METALFQVFMLKILESQAKNLGIIFGFCIFSYHHLLVINPLINIICFPLKIYL